MQVCAHLDRDEVILMAPGMPALVFVRSSLRQTGTVSIWGDTVVALDAGDEPAQWLSDFLGSQSRLALKSGQTHRPLGLGAGGTPTSDPAKPHLVFRCPNPSPAFWRES